MRFGVRLGVRGTYSASIVHPNFLYRPQWGCEVSAVSRVASSGMEEAGEGRGCWISILGSQSWSWQQLR